MKNNINYTLDTCMDILDWFDHPDLEYYAHIMVSKLDGEERLNRALKYIRKQARELVKAHENLDDAYPVNLA